MSNSDDLWALFDADLEQHKDQILDELDDIAELVSVCEALIARLIQDGRARYDESTGRLYDMTGIPRPQRPPGPATFNIQGIAVQLDVHGAVSLFSQPVSQAPRGPAHPSPYPLGEMRGVVGETRPG